MKIKEIYKEVSICSKEIGIYVNLPAKTVVYCHVKNDYIGCIVTRGTVNEVGIAIFKINFSNYFFKEGVLFELILKDKKNETIPFKYGDCCADQCSIVLKTVLCNEHRNLVLNHECMPAFEEIFTQDVTICEWNYEVNVCEWIINEKKMIDYLFLNEKRFELSSKPVIFEAGVGVINPKFIEELNAIEDGTWEVTLDADGLNIKHIDSGLFNTEFVDGCTYLAKTCEKL